MFKTPFAATPSCDDKGQAGAWRYSRPSSPDRAVDVLRPRLQAAVERRGEKVSLMGERPRISVVVAAGEVLPRGATPAAGGAFKSATRTFAVDVRHVGVQAGGFSGATVSAERGRPISERGTVHEYRTDLRGAFFSWHSA